MPTVRHHVELCSMQLSESGDGFVMELADGTGEAVRLEFPGWMIHQLMRALPHLDAAVQRGEAKAPGELIAYPLLDWNVEHTGADLGVAIHLRNDRQVDAAFQVDLAQAAALHRALGDALARAATAGPLSAAATPSAH